MARRLTEQEKEEIRELVEHRTHRQVAKEYGVSTSTISAIRNSSEPPPQKSIERRFEQDSGYVSTKSLNIKTLDEALAVAEVDLEVWEVDRYTINSWEVTMGGRSSGTGKPETYTNWQVKAWLKRKIVEPLEQALTAVCERLVKRVPKPRPVKRRGGDILLEICLFDAHFGMLAWRAETGEDYDATIAEDVYVNAVNDLLNRGRPWKPEKILFPIGQDFFHINTPDNLTPQNKNRLDVDGRWAKVLEAGKMAVIKAIQLCRQVADVEVLWIPGNHDPQTSYALTQVLWALHKDDKHVHVDTSPRIRKVRRYGDTVIGYAHGSDEPMKELPRIFMDDFPAEWAGASFRELHIGHRHKKREISWRSGEEIGSTLVRTIPSLCATDAWHYSKGYIGRKRAAQSFVYDKKCGPVASLMSYTHGGKK